VRTELRREACLIDGAWVTGERWIDVDNPATGEVIGHVPSLEAQAANDAVAAAARAMPSWAAKTASERSEILRRFFNLILSHQDELAEILTAEQGKPIAEAHSEIRYAASFLEWYAEEGKRTYGEVLPPHATDRRLLVLKQPVGVVAAITPWNFPAAMITRKIAPALAAGCGVVVKPAVQTPFTALALGVIAQQAGLPDGLLNIITGDARIIGTALCANPVVRKLSFTGSTEVGAALFAQSAPTIKKLSLELGGNAPFIVFDDADIDAAVRGAVQSKFRNAGQTCVSANRIYVHELIYDAFLEKLATAVRALVVNAGNMADADIGPLIDEGALAKVETHITDAVSKGAVVITGGGRHALGGRFFQPTVIRNVVAGMRVLEEETFGPLAPVASFSDEGDVIAQANATPYGLAAYVYTRDVGRVWRVAEALEAGIVGVNTGLISTEVAPFGGVKSSGIGREGSRHGIDDYLEMKYVCIGL